MSAASVIWCKRPLCRANGLVAMPICWATRRWRAQAHHPVRCSPDFHCYSPCLCFAANTLNLTSPLFRLAELAKHLQPASYAPSLYQDLPPIGDQKADEASAHMYHNNIDLFSSKFGMMLPDPAPDPGIQLPDAAPEPDVQPSKHYQNRRCLCVSDQSPLNFHESVVCTFPAKPVDTSLEMGNPNEPRKKKYAKEAWPGRKPLFSGL